MSEASVGIEIDPAGFLRRTCERLSAKENVDLEVSSILATMLTSSAGPSAGVLAAREALRMLAAARVAAGNLASVSK